MHWNEMKNTPYVMKTAITLFILISGLFILTSSKFAVSAPLDREGRWYLEKYGEVTDPDNPFKVKANQILNIVWQTAQPLSVEKPKLGIIPSDQDRFIQWWAFITKDNWIILVESLYGLTHGGVKIDAARADSRLAFILSHELGHLIQNSKQAVAEPRSFSPTTRRFGQNPDIRIETEADHYAVFTLSKAGYDPQAILGTANSDFFKLYYLKVRNKYLNINLGQTLENRSFQMQHSLHQFSEKLTIFDQAVQDYNRGFYKKAAEHFEAFLVHYDGREILNNLGLSYFQASNRYVAGCRQDRFRLKVATYLETETRARKLIPEDLIVSAEDEGKCDTGNEYQALLRNAQKRFEQVRRYYPEYWPVHANLSALMIRKGEFHSAALLAQQALKIRSPSDHGKNNLAVALYLGGNGGARVKALLSEISENSDLGTIVEFNMESMFVKNDPFYK